MPTSIFTGIVIFAFMAVYNGFNDSNKEFRTDIKETVARLEQKVDKKVDNFESKLNSLTDTVDNIDVKVNGVICGYFLAFWLVTRPEGHDRAALHGSQAQDQKKAVGDLRVSVFSH